MEIVVILIPIVAAIYVFREHNKKVVWWEYIILILGSIILYLITKMAIIGIITSDTEYLGGYITKTTYYEPWTELVTVTKTDEKGETYTVEEKEYHSEKYTYQTNISKKEKTCTRKEHEELKHLFSTYPKFRELNRRSYDKDGDAYDYFWGGSNLTMRTITEKHIYKNPMKGSNSIFKLTGKDKEKLYEYPKIKDKDQRVLIGRNNIIDQRLRILNARLGKEYQIRVFVLIFPGEYGVSISEEQKRYWEGGNKNELVVCLGLRGDSVVWCNPFSWCDSPEIETRIKGWYIENPNFDLVSFCDYLEPLIKKYWVRKKFSDFNYITTEIPIWGYLIIFIITLIYVTLISNWIVHNKY